MIWGRWCARFFHWVSGTLFPRTGTCVAQCRANACYALFSKVVKDGRRRWPGQGQGHAPRAGTRLAGLAGLPRPSPGRNIVLRARMFASRAHPQSPIWPDPLACSRRPRACARILVKSPCLRMPARICVQVCSALALMHAWLRPYYGNVIAAQYTDCGCVYT